MKWVKVEDRLPDFDDDYLTYVMDNGCSYRMEVQRFYKNPRILKGIYANSSTHWEKTTWDDNIVTHWQTLPKAPNETDDLINEIIREGYERMAKNTWMPTPEKTI